MKCCDEQVASLPPCLWIWVFSSLQSKRSSYSNSDDFTATEDGSLSLRLHSFTQGATGNEGAATSSEGGTRDSLRRGYGDTVDGLKRFGVVFTTERMDDGC